MVSKLVLPRQASAMTESERLQASKDSEDSFSKKLDKMMNEFKEAIQNSLKNRFYNDREEDEFLDDDGELLVDDELKYANVPAFQVFDQMPSRMEEKSDRRTSSSKLPSGYITHQLLQERRNRELCDFCDQPYTAEHYVSHKKLLIRVIEMEEEDEDDPEKQECNLKMPTQVFDKKNLANQSCMKLEESTILVMANQIEMKNNMLLANLQVAYREGEEYQVGTPFLLAESESILLQQRPTCMVEVMKESLGCSIWPELAGATGSQSSTVHGPLKLYTIISDYCECERNKFSHRLLDKMMDRNDVPYNTLISNVDCNNDYSSKVFDRGRGLTLIASSSTHYWQVGVKSEWVATQEARGNEGRQMFDEMSQRKLGALSCSLYVIEWRNHFAKGMLDQIFVVDVVVAVDEHDTAHQQDLFKSQEDNRSSDCKAAQEGVNVLAKAGAGRKDEASFSTNAATQASRKSYPQVNNEEVQQDATQFYGTAGEQALVGSDGQYWDNLYPGWKFDSSAGQWHQVDDYASTTSAQSHGYEKKSQEYIQENMQEVGNKVILGQESEKYHVQQLETHAAEASTEVWDKNNSDQASQWNSGYPPNMAFDPQYPEWYYDMNTQQWLMLESYHQRPQQAVGIVQESSSQDANAPNGFISKDNSSLYNGVGQYEQNSIQSHNNQNMELDWSSNGYSQQNMWQTEPINHMDAGYNCNYSNNGNFNGSIRQQNSSNLPFPLSNHDHSSSDGSTSGGKFMPTESMSFYSQPKIEKYQQGHSFHDYYGNQKSTDYSQLNSQQPFHPASVNSGEGRSSAGRPPHALVTFGFGTKPDYGSMGTVAGSISILSLMEVVMDKTDTSGIMSRNSGYFQALCRQPFPGPLVGGVAAVKDVNKWIDEMISNCELPLMDIRKGEQLRLLCSLPKISCHHYGKLRSPFGADPSLEGRDAPESAVTELFEGTSCVKRHGPSSFMVASTKIIAGLGMWLGIDILEAPGTLGAYRTQLNPKAITKSKVRFAPLQSGPSIFIPREDEYKPGPAYGYEFGVLPIKASVELLMGITVLCKTTIGDQSKVFDRGRGSKLTDGI